MMDTSETYIKMCDCEEIQKQWEVRLADYFTMPYEHGYVNVRAIQGEGWFERQRCGYIRLPRQDQLQEMMDTENALATACWFSCTALSTLQADYYNQFRNSMEQLWLAFVMKEKYGKVWNGENWEAND